MASVSRSHQLSRRLGNLLFYKHCVMEVATRVQFCDPNQIVYVGLPPSGLGHVTLTEIITTQTDQGLSSQFDPSFEASANIIAGFVSNEKCNSDVKCIPFLSEEALMV